MNVVSKGNELLHYLDLAAQVSKQYPVVVSEFIENAKEIEIDAVAKDGDIMPNAISEHVEVCRSAFRRRTMVFPSQKIYF